MVWWVLQKLSTEIKKSFFLFLPSHPHKCGSSALFIGGSRVRAGVRVELLPSHLSSHYPHTSGTGKFSVRGLLQNLTKVPEKYSYLVPTVQHRYTNSIAMLHYQYSYAAPSVYLCCTFGARVPHFYRHYYSKVFTVAFLAVAELRSFCNTILNSIILNRRSRQFFILHSSFKLAFPPAAEPCFLIGEADNSSSFILHSSFKLLHCAL